MYILYKHMFSSMIKVSDTEEPELEEFCLNLKMNILRDIKKTLLYI